MRQKRKQILTITAALLALLAGFGPLVATKAGALVESVVTNPLTGVALDGYDPVSYFLPSGPLKGSPDYVAEYQGVPWYFASAANRDVFQRHPEIYAPQFGGHCAMGLTRGYLSDGRPELYVIDHMKLYLFYSLANREAFLATDSISADIARLNWNKMSPEISGPQPDIAASLQIAG